VNRNTRTVARLVGIVVAVLICSVLAYFVSSLITGHQLATSSNNIAYTRWQEKFLSLTIATGVLTGICSLIWFTLSRWVFKIRVAEGIGRRTIWALLALVSLGGNILIPKFYSSALGIQINAVVIAFFITFFTVIGYWIVSIFITPEPFKYTPLGAQIFRH